MATLTLGGRTSVKLTVSDGETPKAPVHHAYSVVPQRGMREGGEAKNGGRDGRNFGKELTP